MCQELEKQFLQLLAGMPKEVSCDPLKLLWVESVFLI